MNEIKRIASFSVNHDYIDEGIYISRVDGDVTTYDMRTRKPNAGDYMDNLTMHSLEHLFATLVRQSAIGDRVIYFGPMGCQTGFYLLIRNADHVRVFEEVKKVINLIKDSKGPVFGNSEVECGNYRTLNLGLAHYEAERYAKVLDAWTDMTFSYQQ